MMQDFIQSIPKAELHLHIEGTFEPELMFEISKRNNVPLKFDSVDELKKAYNFGNLQDFLDIYYAGANALKTKEDFFELTWAYLSKAHSQNVVHAEIMFDPQTHTDRGIKFSTVIEGIKDACIKAEKEFGMSTVLIMSYLRHLSEESALKTLKESLDYKEWITFVGLDSSEVGNPPAKFARVFEESAKAGYKLTAHAGEEGPAEYVWEALDLLKVERIDHGNRALEDERLVERLAKEEMALTVCPLSNLKLCVVDKIENHPIRKMLNNNLCATVNSDDPAYFGGYINENYSALVSGVNLDKKEIISLAKNSFKAAVMNEERKNYYINKLDSFLD